MGYIVVSFFFYNIIGRKEIVLFSEDFVFLDLLRKKLVFKGKLVIFSYF